MVAIADFEGTPAPVLTPGRKLTIALVGTSFALCLAAGGFIFQGGGFAARLVLSVSSLAFVIAYIAKPLYRLIPSDATRALARGLTCRAYGMRDVQRSAPAAQRSSISAPTPTNHAATSRCSVL